MTKRGTLHIGTSNIVLPGNKQSFPAEFQNKSRLHYYSYLFNSIEVNSSFYKIPQFKTLQNWSGDVTENFTFTFKLWRDITHTQNFITDLNNIDIFLKALEGIGKKKACILLQFPGKITLNYYNEVEKIVSHIALKMPSNGWRIALEFRSATWYVHETYELLNEYGTAIVLHDMPKSKNDIYTTEAPFIYQRFHGANGDYRGSYSDDFLKEKFQNIQGWLSTGKDVYVYFNNTIGNAFDNAVTLRKMIDNL